MNYIRVRHAAKFLRYSSSHVYKLVNEGHFSKYYVGKKSYLLDKAEVVSYPLRQVVERLK